VFNTPATLTLAYTDAELGGVPEANLRIFWHDGFQWRYVGGAVDASKNTVTAQISHLSTYALFPVSAATSTSKAPQKFLSPALMDGVNDIANFGPNAGEVTILDSEGREVFHASQDDLGSALVWPCKDSSGRMVPSGAYIAKIKEKSGSTVYQNFAVVK
jgi:hypothetical protein